MSIHYVNDKFWDHKAALKTHIKTLEDAIGFTEQALESLVRLMATISEREE